ncbi:MAG: chitobiase/beta-hexosaminidase C-terminal domain-containing protein [Lachnospiraceae bacterium]|nr:chitobiase/beta-hexosaminidase C-terminal domain-containing protein [Lachnospiraceae bacterium]
MLTDKEGKCVKQQKSPKSEYKRPITRKVPSFQLTLGLMLSVLCVFLAAGLFLSSSKAMEELKFVTNNNVQLNTQGSSWAVMDGAKVYIDNYTQDSGIEIYYKFYDAELADTSGIVLKQEGTKYAEGASITLNRSASEDGRTYFYVQQFEGEESRMDCYKISFYEKAAVVTVTPETADNEMATLRAGDTIRFAGSGALYYTLDGTAPSFVRTKKGNAGDVTVNGEDFSLGSSSMQKLPVSNSLEVLADWISQETITIRVISCTDGNDFSPVATFRYKFGQDQVASPTISPSTTAESPVTVPDETNAALSCETEGATILYTLSGNVPTYTIMQEDLGGAVSYYLQPGSGTYIYENKIAVTGNPGSEFTITAMAVKFNETYGLKVMKDSEPVQFVYRFADMETASAPESSPESGTSLALGDKIYLNTLTSNGTILYTTDGTSPSYTFDEQSKKIVPAEGTVIYGEKYSWITADEEAGASNGSSFLIQAKTICIDMESGEKLLEDSPVVQLSFSINDAETVAAPTATPTTKESSPTTVEAGDKILLNTVTSGAKIYYTTNGSAPVLDDQGNPKNDATKLYSGQQAYIVPEGTGYLTITAMAVKDGMNNSAVAQFTYQYPGSVAPPYCTPAEGTVSINTEVELASLDKDALIYYTLDGSDPTEITGRLYSDPLLLTEDTTIKAICVLDGISSSVRTFQFTVSPVLMPPTPSIKSGSVVTSGTTIKLSAQSGAEIAYTTDGSNPKTGSPMSGDTVTITGKAGETITLITYAKGSDFSDSQTATYVYTISNYENGITVTPESGSSVQAGDVIRMDTDVTDAVIYYETGGAAPTSSSAQGSQVTVPVSDGDDKFILKAAAVAGGTSFPNAVGTWQYTYLEELVAPKASIPDLAVLLRPQEIELTAEEGDIYYTVDGSWPDENANLYTEKITVDEQLTILAFAMNEEGAKSEVVSFTYTFASQVEKPQFSIYGGEVETGTLLTIRSETPDAVIYYTLDGQVPDIENPSNLYTYSGAITINKPVNIKAIAVKDRMTNSEVTSAVFTVKEAEVQEEKAQEEEKISASGGSRLMSRRSYLNSGSGPSYTDFVLKSPMTGVVLSAKEGTLPADAQIEVTQTAVDSALNRSVQESAGDDYGAVAGYEVLAMQNQEAISITENVEVGFPIPQQYRNCAISIASVDEEGNVELFDTRRDHDMAYAFVNRLGDYCLVAPVYLEETEENMDFGIIIAGCTLLLFAAGYLLLRFAKKKGETDEQP